MLGWRLLSRFNCNSSSHSNLISVLNTQYTRHYVSRRTECGFKIGDSASLSRTFNHTHLKTLAGLILDFNPIHFDPEYAKNTRFKQCIVHGVLINGLVSAVIATHIPGPGAVYLSSSIEFPNALFVDEPVTSEVTVTSIKGMVMTLNTVATATDRDKIVLKGKARVLVPKFKMKIVYEK
ncbi:(R)-specific enoyl-CoA hydratase [Octopus bimaculoides]|uniref:MaoC-like domain-containing protein n=1 Tax=Octopus bimaculoides TaxID=37653 RepID=A0A0L8HMH7_OCTBM|nr:(R)-specific enoyl-CoA hydratase [Octopus bimaculoides]|eukprot:XP_014771052.1 PREDICTED: (R)-specific enoyl-CoA hydratase-like [Octopus bimaculoides]